LFSEKLLAEAGSVPRMNYLGTFSCEHARSKIQRITSASFIYKGGQRYSQEEKSSVAFATETQRLREKALKDFCDFRFNENDLVTRIDSTYNLLYRFTSIWCRECVSRPVIDLDDSEVFAGLKQLH
jgi:hypothetical protein